MQKKIPQRQCMGCRERKAKREMIRVVRGTDGHVSLDFGGKMNGRGAYICPNADCLKKYPSGRFSTIFSPRFIFALGNVIMVYSCLLFFQRYSKLLEYRVKNNRKWAILTILEWLS
mgnify:CR=1 FL=1